MSPFKTLLTVAFLSFLGLGALVATYVLLDEGQGLRKMEVVPVTIEDLRISIPRRFFRGGIYASTGTVERADLVFLFPDMNAAGLPSGKAEDTPDARLLIFTSIQRSDGVIDPADRVQELYGRFLEPATFNSPGGLLMKRFIADSPYGDEELFIAPPDGRVFAARCRKPEKAPAVNTNAGPSFSLIGEACLWRFRQSGADIQVRFAPELLPQWESMALGIATRLKEWESR